MDYFLKRRLEDRRFSSDRVDVFRSGNVTPWYASSSSRPQRSETSGLVFSKENASCWEGYKRKPGTQEFEKGSCIKIGGPEDNATQTKKRKKKKDGGGKDKESKADGSSSPHSSSSESDGNGGRVKKQKMDKK